MDTKKTGNRKGPRFLSSGTISKLTNNRYENTHTKKGEKSDKHERSDKHEKNKKPVFVPKKWGPSDKSGLSLNKEENVVEITQENEDEIVYFRHVYDIQPPKKWVKYHFNDLITIRNTIIDSLDLDDNEILMSKDFFNNLCKFFYKNDSLKNSTCDEGDCDDYYDFES